jgi:hypothetical protein
MEDVFTNGWSILQQLDYDEVIVAALSSGGVIWPFEFMLGLVVLQHLDSTTNSISWSDPSSLNDARHGTPPFDPIRSTSIMSIRACTSRIFDGTTGCEGLSQLS